MLDLAFGWAAFAIVIVVILLFCFFVVRYYTDRHESEILPTVVTIASLTLSLLALFLIPIDILSVSTQPEAAPQVKTLYFILYGAILLFAFVVIPFSYFYYEEYDEDITIKQRIWGGAKYTIFLVVIVVILLIIGIFIKPGKGPEQGDENVKDWAEYISDSSNNGEGAITFAIACLAMLGFLVWISYTAFGLSAFPIGLLKGKRHLAEEASDIQSDLEVTREKTRAISSKYMTGKKMNTRDEKQFDLLKRQEKTLARRSAQIDQNTKGFARIAHACKPFVFVFGILFFLLSLLLVISIVLTQIDKISSSCGVSCGFFSKYQGLSNPIDLLLWHLEEYFPFDYIVLGGLITYIFFCTLSGIVKIGVRFLWVHLYNIKARQTAPQGLLLTAVLLMLALLVMNMEILTLAPQYASFGTQTYQDENNATVKCSTLAPMNVSCNMTQIGIFVAQIQFGTPFFGNVYYYAMWVFVATFFIGSIVSCVQRKSSNLDDAGDSDDDDGRV